MKDHSLVVQEHRVQIGTHLLREPSLEDISQETCIQSQGLGLVLTPNEE
jgi:hypothetical protein